MNEIIIKVHINTYIYKGWPVIHLNNCKYYITINKDKTNNFHHAIIRPWI